MCVHLCQRSAVTRVAAAAQAVSVCATHQIRDLRVEREVTRRPEPHQNRCSGGSGGRHNSRSRHCGGDGQEVGGGGDPQGLQVFGDHTGPDVLADGK